MLDLLDAFLTKNIVKRFEEQKTICLDCRSPQTLKIFPKKCWTKKCRCGVNIDYYTNQLRDYGTTTFIHAIENHVWHELKKEKIRKATQQQFEAKYLEALTKLGVEPEPLRFYKRYLRRQDFEHRRFTGKIGNP